MEKLTLVLGIALGVAGILVVYYVAARWPVWKAKAAGWFTSEKAAIAAKAQGDVVDLKNRVAALEASGLDALKADVAALKAKVGV